MKSGFTKRDLRRENRRYRGTGGLSQENCCCGFSPAFLDTETGIVYDSRFADGRVAPFHLIDGLPKELIVAHAHDSGVKAVKNSVVAGFVQDGCFYTRDEAAQKVSNIALSSRRLPTNCSANATLNANSNPGAPFRHVAQSFATTALELGQMTLLSGWSLACDSFYPRLWGKLCDSGYDLFYCWADYSINLLDNLSID